MGSWIAAIFLVALFSFAGGVFLGVAIGSINKELDFCGDSTSGSYIFDAEAREKACENAFRR